MARAVTPEWWWCFFFFTASAGEAEVVGRRRANADTLGLNTESRCEAPTHRNPMRSNAWLLADEDAVGIDERISGRFHLLVRLGQ